MIIVSNATPIISLKQEIKQNNFILDLKINN